MVMFHQLIRSVTNSCRLWERRRFGRTRVPDTGGVLERSPGGARLRLRWRPEAGEAVFVEGRPARVRWTSACGGGWEVGVQFVEPSGSQNPRRARRFRIHLRVSIAS
ncbi:MAG: PilZ domain-containing protein, partial [Candidatus Eremiobacterota bacterium]